MTAAALLLSFASSTTRAANVYVDVANETGTEDGTQANPYNTIQEGIDNALEGDRVQVASGLYKETILMKDGVSVLGAGAATTILDAEGQQNSVVTFNHTRLSPILSGFTITGGHGDTSREIDGIPVNVGGGILILTSSPVITQTVIIGNVIDQGYCLGGGIYVYSADSTPLIIDNVISNNVALSTTLPDSGEGGGVYVVSKSGGVVIRGNRIESNQAYTGGALYVENVVSSTAEIVRNTILGNQAIEGGGVFSHDSDSSATSVINNLFRDNGSADAGAHGGAVLARSDGTGAFTIANNTLTGNSVSAGTGGALWLDDSLSTAVNIVANNILASNTALQGGGIDHTASYSEIRNNIFHDNTGGDLHDGGGSGVVLLGNLFVDPRFAGLAVDNYRLQPTSPAIDTADDSYGPPDDLDGFYRPYDGDGDAIPATDVGAFEYPGGEINDVVFSSDDLLEWSAVPLQDAYNVYRGSLTRLLQSGEYSQDSLTEPLAQQFCGILPAELPFSDTFVPPYGEAVFYLATTVISDWESALGSDSTGLVRLHGHPCP